MSSDEMDKSLVPDQPLTGTVFRFKEDYILFGLLVRHGLVSMEDHDSLAWYQGSKENKPPLIDILCETSDSPDKLRKDLQELLNILSKPELKEYLPGNLPMMETVQDLYAKSTINISGRLSDQLIPTPIPRQKINEAETVRHDEVTRNLNIFSNDVTEQIIPGIGESSVTDNSLLSSLTQDEVKRIQDASTSIPLVGKIFSNHVILDKIGGGAQGDVYLAKQLSLNRYVALKRLHGTDIDENNQFFRIFREEARTVGNINHPNIVQVYDIFAADGQAFFTMESIEGQTIRDLVKNANGPLEIDLVANIACQACSALSRTSEDNLVHRDIKPANMMLDKNGSLKIVDFGLAAATAALEEGAGFAGTPIYAAPEQFSGKSITASVDQYALAVTLYEALTGENPFKGTKMIEVADKHRDLKVKPPSQINNELSTDVDKVILRMLAKTPEERFANFDDCYSAWEKILTKAKKGAKASTAALLGESLLRLGKDESSKLKMRGSILVIAWFFMVAGIIYAHNNIRYFQGHDLIELAGNVGTIILVFSLFCIFYVALARRKVVPVFGSLKAWLYTHIATAIPAIILLLLHSGNFLFGIMPGGPTQKPLLSILMTLALIVTAASGSVGLLIFRALRRHIQIQEMGLRKGEDISARQSMMIALSAQLLSGWRLVHYPLAVLFIVLSILHIIVSIQFQGGV